MKTRFLFPNSLKKIGWIILIPSAILGLYVIFADYELFFLTDYRLTLYSNKGWFKFIVDNLTNELAGVGFLIGAILVAFSKEKQEDEYIAKIRLESLLWATYLNYAFLLFGIMFVYGIPFLTLMVFNMFTVLILFIIRFNLVLSRNNLSLKVHAE
jgi:hypothetical protein